MCNPQTGKQLEERLSNIAKDIVHIVEILIDHGKIQDDILTILKNQTSSLKQVVDNALAESEQNKELQTGEFYQ